MKYIGTIILHINNDFFAIVSNTKHQRSKELKLGYFAAAYKADNYAKQIRYAERKIIEKTFKLPVQKYLFQAVKTNFRAKH